MKTNQRNFQICGLPIRLLRLEYRHRRARRHSVLQTRRRGLSTSQFGLLTLQVELCFNLDLELSALVDFLRILSHVDLIALAESFRFSVGLL